MQAFLEEIADHILGTYAGKTGDICIVTPNRRAGLFLRKYFSVRVKAPIWAPDTMSIEDFVNQLSGLSICDNLDLVFELYECYRQTEKEQADSVEAFLNWAPALLRDFDDIDSSLVSRQQVYSDISDYRHMDLWVPGENELTPFQKKYLGFVDRMQVYHESLADHLMNKGMAWQGLSTNLVARKIQKGELSLPWDKVIFTGFNALTGAEEAIVKSLLVQNKAEFLMDEDPYYSDDPHHEAGRFIRKYKKELHLDNQQGEPGSHFKIQGKTIRIFGIAKNVNQARLAGNLLLNSSEISRDEDTAIVLANESLLIPTLNALPESVNDINVTMGYPLSSTNMFGFFDAIFQLFMQAGSGKDDSKNPIAYHHKDIQRFFSHSNTAILWELEQGKVLCQQLLQSLREGNESFLTFKQICALTKNDESFEQKFAFLNQKDDYNPADIFSTFLNLAGALDALFRKKAAMYGGDIIRTPFFADFESLYFFSRIFRKVITFSQRFPYLTSVKTLYRLFRQTAGEARLSFTGEPLQGLQVMGLLETRALDFKNVIILAANENILPKSSVSSSFIPYEVKRNRGLRVYHDQDAIYAYHFYRLLQRAKNITIIYNTQAEDIGSSEKSRYITQLLQELPAYNPGISISENIVSLQPIPGQSKDELKVSKTTDIMKRLEEISQRGFSPSALGDYIRCPLQFYLKRVARIDEAEAVEETMESMTVGSIVHGVLESLYLPYVGHVLQPKDIENMRDSLSGELSSQFEKLYPGGHISSGKNLLTKHLIRRYLENFLEAELLELKKLEAKNQHLTIEGLEMQLSSAFILNTDGQPQSSVTIKGMADRIDRIGDVTRILDYKTGKVESHELKFSDWSEPFNDFKKNKSFQLLTYAWLYYKVHPDTKLAIPGILSLRSPGKGVQELQIQGEKGSTTREQLTTFEQQLSELLEKILNPAEEFAQTEETDNCRYCPFTALCSRHVKN